MIAFYFQSESYNIPTSFWLTRLKSDWFALIVNVAELHWVSITDPYQHKICFSGYEFEDYCWVKRLNFENFDKKDSPFFQELYYIFSRSM